MESCQLCSYIKKKVSGTTVVIAPAIKESSTTKKTEASANNEVFRKDETTQKTDSLKDSNNISLKEELDALKIEVETLRMKIDSLGKQIKN